MASRVIEVDLDEPVVVPAGSSRSMPIGGRRSSTRGVPAAATATLVYSPGSPIPAATSSSTASLRRSSVRHSTAAAASNCISLLDDEPSPTPVVSASPVPLAGKRGRATRAVAVAQRSATHDGDGEVTVIDDDTTTATSSSSIAKRRRTDNSQATAAGMDANVWGSAASAQATGRAAPSHNRPPAAALSPRLAASYNAASAGGGSSRATRASAVEIEHEEAASSHMARGTTSSSARRGTTSVRGRGGGGGSHSRNSESLYHDQQGDGDGDGDTFYRDMDAVTSTRSSRMGTAATANPPAPGAGARGGGGGASSSGPGVSSALSRSLAAVLGGLLPSGSFLSAGVGRGGGGAAHHFHTHAIPGYPFGSGGGGGSGSHLHDADRDFGPEDYEALLRLDESSKLEDEKKYAAAREAKIARVPIVSMPDRRASSSASSSTAGSSTRVAASNVVDLSRDDLPVLVPPAALHRKAPAAIAADSMNEECCICKDDMPPGSKVKIILGCLHKFHPVCIDTWIRVNPVCPICKTEIP